MATKLQTVKNIYKSILFAAIAAFAFCVTPALTSCDRSSSIGTDLVSEETTVIVDSAFTITSRSEINNAVLSRTIVQMLGVIDTPDFGYFSSDVVTQFMPANLLDTAGMSTENIDSISLVMLVSTKSYIGDTLAILGADIYPLTRQLEAPIYSNFNPEGYYDSSRKLGTLVYNLTKAIEPASQKNNQYYTLSVTLPLELGRSLFSEYISNSSTFANPENFAKFFPGLYIKNTYGSGRVVRIGNTTLKMHYHRSYRNDNGNDTTVYGVGNYFAVTPEIITNNDITMKISSAITERVSDGESILLAPAGMDVEIKFPGREIIAAYKAGIGDGIGVINRLNFRLPVRNIENNYNIGAPSDVLLVLKKERDEFFLQNKLPDNVTSFRASLSSLSDGSLCYTFPSMREYVLDLMKKETITDDDVTFLLVPVLATTETNSSYYDTSTTLTAITPYVLEPKMTQILPEKAKIHFVYSRQTTNF